MKKVSIYFWEPVLSPHKSSLFQQLSVHCDVSEVWCIAQATLTSDRVSQGWSMPDMPGVNIVIAPDQSQVTQIVECSTPNSIHVFSGIHWVPCIVQGIKATLRAGRRFGIMSEPRASEGILGVLRLCHSWTTEKRIRRNAQFVLAIGRNGPTWFRSSGYSLGKIFPFAYFLTPVKISEATERSARGRGRIRIAYVGRLTRDKGFHIFLKALEKLSSLVEVTIIGAGEELALLASFIEQKEIPLDYVEAVPMEEMPAYLSQSDVVVVPSTVKDGWSAVVSEALFAGAAVVATTNVGASICLTDDFLGVVTKSGSDEAIAQGVEHLINCGALSDMNRRLRSEWAAKHLTGEVGAQYLLQIFRHTFEDGVRPLPFYAG